MRSARIAALLVPAAAAGWTDWLTSSLPSHASSRPPTAAGSGPCAGAAHLASASAGECEDIPSRLERAYRVLQADGGDRAHDEMLPMFDADSDGRVSFREAWRHGLGATHFAYYDRSPADGALEYSEWIRCARELLLYAAADLESPPPPGHLQPLGRHGTPAPVGELADLFEFAPGQPPPIHPRRFWAEQVARHRPALLRGAGRFSRAFREWGEERLAAEYGDVAVKVEPAVEARGSSEAQQRLHAGGSVPHNGRTSLRRLLALPASQGAYGVTILPQKMAWEVALPPPVLCAGRRRRLAKRERGPGLEPDERVAHPYPNPKAPWLTHLLENNLWVGRGRSRSQLHFDKENIVNCLFSGEKRWTLIDTRAHASEIAWVRGGRYNSTDDFLNAGTDWVAVDTDSVDLRIHRGLAKAAFTVLTQKAGDCIFVPYSMLHAVEKLDDGLGVAVSYMWQPMEEYDEEACSQIEGALAAPSRLPSGATTDGGDGGAGSWLPLGAADVLWHYSGDGVIPQGYLDPAEELLPELIRMMEMTGRTQLTREVFLEWIGANGDSRISDERFDGLWTALVAAAGAPEGGGLREEQLWWSGPGDMLRLWQELAVEADPEGMLACDVGFHYLGRSAAEDEEMAQAAERFARGGRTGAEVGAETGAGAGAAADGELWHAPSVAAVPLTGPQGRLFNVHADLRVLVIDGPQSTQWLPAGGVDACATWSEMRAAGGMEVNSYSCHVTADAAARMLSDFTAAHGRLLRAAFGVTRCEHRRERKTFMTLLSRDLAADNLHADGCDTSSLQGGEYFTIMAYPHARWESEWGGHTEFAARKCGDAEVEDAALGAATPAVLRVAPLPERTVVFEGALLHRATWPREGAGNGVEGAGAGPGDRASTVMQVGATPSSQTASWLTCAAFAQVVCWRGEPDGDAESRSEL